MAFLYCVIWSDDRVGLQQPERDARWNAVRLYSRYDGLSDARNSLVFASPRDATAVTLSNPMCLLCEMMAGKAMKEEPCNVKCMLLAELNVAVVCSRALYGLQQTLPACTCEGPAFAWLSMRRESFKGIQNTIRLGKSSQVLIPPTFCRRYPMPALPSL